MSLLDVGQHEVSATFIHDIVRTRAATTPDALAIRYGHTILSYAELENIITAISQMLLRAGAERGSRVAVLLPNCPDAVAVAFASFSTGLIFVPINPLLRARQAMHVLRDSGASVLFTTENSLASLQDSGDLPKTLDTVILTGASAARTPTDLGVDLLHWRGVPAQSFEMPCESPGPDSLSEPAVIFYTSGSTGMAKGVLVSHQNLIDGVQIVSGYLCNTTSDRILAVLPLSFDYGFSQITTTLCVGAEVVLTNYSLPQQLLTEASKYKVTGIAGVPTMWSQLSVHRWPDDIAGRLRYVTNSGGRMPSVALCRLREKLPETRVFLMYGLTEAFRSTYLEPTLLDRHPDSIGTAIPGVSLHVVRKDGTSCDFDEPGELVHSGALVALGYWNNAKATAERFRPLPTTLTKSAIVERAVWTGDIVRRGDDGLLYFVERADEMLKCSGYRVSPTEIEEVVLDSQLVEQAVVCGIPSEALGHKIGLVVASLSTHGNIEVEIRRACAQELPPYMQPTEIVFVDSIPLTATGKPDRAQARALLDSSISQT